MPVRGVNEAVVLTIRFPTISADIACRVTVEL